MKPIPTWLLWIACAYTGFVIGYTVAWIRKKRGLPV
jgi:hypothetical protein